MRTALVSLLNAWLITFAPAQNVADLDKIRVAHEKSVALAEAKHRERVLEFQKVYVAVLARHENVAKAKGDIEAVLAIRGERERLDRELTPEEIKALPNAARASRTRFDQNVARSLALERSEVMAQNRAYAGVLQGLQTRLTRAGDTEGAARVKDALDALLSGKKAER